MKRVVGCGVVGFFLVVLFLGSLAWAVWLHSVVSRAERAVDRAWTELETSYRQRAELVPQLVDRLRSATLADPALLERLLQAREEAFDVLPTPELVNDAERFDRFRRLQERLEDALGEVSEAARKVPADPAGTGLAGRLDAIHGRIDERTRAFDEAAAEYNRLLARWPSSWVARIAGFREAVTFGN